MNNVDDDHHFSASAALRDGTPVTIRVMRPDDKERLAAAFGKLDSMSVYTRFFSFRKELPERSLERLAAIDFVRLAGLVATVGARDEETIIGSATYVAVESADAVPTAEVAFTIEEDVQGQGLAGRLLGALTTIARRHGIQRFTAEVLADNAAMLAVFARSGLPMRRRRDAGVLHIELDLGADPT
ncbi:MAG TPA: GNAT family N-acetyltransferase [Caldimonas sp.]|jgi:RimJ/RimL family protein N-acetyltransferase|nr:GNAT family N-acetyltransferase [Caldimonas sp.]HEX4234698.1 GNAT family N-acetyltransferase [Caldimonas sp.]